MPLARRLPKFGFHSPHRTEYQIINVEALEACVANGRLPKGETITPDTLWEAGLINRQGMPVKILGRWGTHAEAEHSSAQGLEIGHRKD